MGRIVVLDENTSNKIAAGEVVERPASVVKELVENSIDAGAGMISVEIRNGGISYIKVTDNGSGIDEDDVEIAFERHATSKIRSADDLESVKTMGFRGEALASIASVSVVELTTRVQKNAHGTYIRIEGGNVKEVKHTGCQTGTSFIVRDMFYNTPARYKFLKKDSTEAGYVSDIINRLALANPHISFRLISGGSTVVHTPGNNDLQSTIYSIYGKQTAKELAEINYAENGAVIKGYAGKPEIARANRNQQSIFINGRYIKSKIIASAIDEAYKTYLLKNKFPFIVLKLELNPLLIDVNVHPTKMEVRFSNEQDIFRSIYHAVTNALHGKSLMRTIELDGKDKKLFKFDIPKTPSEVHTQQNIEAFRFSSNAPVVKETENENYPIYKNNIFKMENNIDEEQKIQNSIKEQAAEEINKKEEVSVPTVNENNNWVENEVTEEIALPSEPVMVAKLDGEASVEESKDISDFQYPPNPLLDAKIIGQAFLTYIILQNEEELLLIDQHAAHERIMYERLREKFLKNETLSQYLLAPVVIELTHQEIKCLEAAEEFFKKLGFEYENFGNNSFIVRTVPCSSEGIDVKQMFLDVIDFTMNSGKSDFKLIADETIHTVACKAAVKANKSLNDAEIKELIRALSLMENPYTCPHGRPTIVKIGKYEMEKMFKRVL